MPETRVSVDEYYPFFSIDNVYAGDPQIQVPAETLNRWRKTLEDFDTVQTEIEQAWETQTEEGQAHARLWEERRAQLRGRKN